MSNASELCLLTATDAVGLLRRREVAPLELVEAAARRIEAIYRGRVTPGRRYSR